MTTYQAIPNSQIDQNSPLTQDLLTLMRDNPIAITEGADNAPRNKSQSLQPLTDRVGSSSGFASTNNVILGRYDMTFTRSYRWILAGNFVLNTVPAGDTSELLWQVSNHDSTWTTAMTILASNGTTETFSGAQLLLPNGTFRYYRLVATGDSDHNWTATELSLYCVGQTL